jgi:hypothetical protein
VVRSFVWCLLAMVLAGCGGAGGSSVSPTGGNGLNLQPDPFGPPMPLSSVLSAPGKSGMVMYLDFVAPSGELVRTYAGTPLGLQTSLLNANVVDGFTATFGPSAPQLVVGCAMVVLTTPPVNGAGLLISVIDANGIAPVEVGNLIPTVEPPGAFLPNCVTLNALTYTLAAGHTYGFVLSTIP